METFRISNYVIDDVVFKSEVIEVLMYDKGKGHQVLLTLDKIHYNASVSIESDLDQVTLLRDYIEQLPTEFILPNLT